MLLAWLKKQWFSFRHRKCSWESSWNDGLGTIRKSAVLNIAVRPNTNRTAAPTSVQRSFRLQTILRFANKSLISSAFFAIMVQCIYICGEKRLEHIERMDLHVESLSPVCCRSVSMDISYRYLSWRSRLTVQVLQPLSVWNSTDSFNIFCSIITMSH